MTRLPNLSDEKQVQDLGRKADRLLHKRQKALRQMLTDPGARAYFWALLCHCGVFKSSFDGQSLRMAFNEGMRNMGLIVLSDITTAAPDLYSVMQAEAKEEEENG